MSRYTLPATPSSPAIDFDPGSGELRLAGESYPENCAGFYRELFERLEAFLRERPGAPLGVVMEIVYFNSSSSKVFMDLFDLLDGEAADGRKVSVEWRYHEDNDIAQECGEEFREDVSSIAFRLVPLTG
jgi:hypothetical protein